ncbi:helix-turn-helix domain-containing protein [Streptomyces sp. NPDC088864]|uniref:helix-turn-helix domain-containing protein n=1 Tax=Streptomyces sp. NPDC088864 TaxID=3365910 RepID=UPI0037FF135E
MTVDEVGADEPGWDVGPDDESSVVVGYGENLSSSPLRRGPAASASASLTALRPTAASSPHSSRRATVSAGGIEAVAPVTRYLRRPSAYLGSPGARAPVTSRIRERGGSTPIRHRARIARMASIDARMLGERIRDARKRAGMSQEDLGQAVGLERTVVNKIEGGVRRVTALELADIAGALGVRMFTFFEDPVPALVSHRSSQGLDTVDSQIDALLANLAGEVEFVDSLGVLELDLAAADAVARAGITPPSTNSEAEALATKARALMELSEDEPICRLSDTVAALGLLAFSRNIGKDTADAGTILLRRGGVSLVNSHMKVGRRRLALAHELGHYLVADDYTIDWRVSWHSASDAPMESRFDRFARALLLPRTAFRREWQKKVEQYEVRNAAILLASEFRVDMATLATRLRELDLADGETSSAVREFRTTQTDIVELNLKVPIEELEGTSIPRGFALAVLRLVRDERISRDRALELLQGTFDESDLPHVRARRADEIWRFVS